MWSPLLVSLLFLLGTTTAFSSSNSSDAMTEAQLFVNRMEKSVAMKDREKIGELFESHFVFKGCNGDNSREVTITTLINLVTRSNFSMSLKSAEFIENDKIQCLIEGNGFRGKFVHFELILNRKSQKAMTGHALDCHIKPRNRRMSSFDIGNQFVQFKLVPAIASRNVSMISDVFQEEFKFEGCKGTYDKPTAVAILSNLPPSANITMRTKEAGGVGESVWLLVKISGFESDGIVAKMLMNQIVPNGGNGRQSYSWRTHTLASGNIPACAKKEEKKEEKRMARGPASDAHAKRFLEELKKSVRRLKDAMPLEMFFDDKFEIKGCKGTYDKAASIAQLRRMDTENPFDYDLHSSYFDGKGQIVINTSIYGVWDDFTADLVYHPVRNQLISGEYTSCKKESSSQ